MSDEWIRWDGRGDQPAPDGEMVEVMLRTRKVYTGSALSMGRKYQGREIGWRQVGDRLDIIAYRKQRLIGVVDLGDVLEDYS